MDFSQFLLVLVVILGAARMAGVAARRLGQPAVLGELIAGTLVGRSALGWVVPDEPTIHLLSELGVVLLLFEIGLETDLAQLVKVGGVSFTVAVVGVVAPMLLGVLACRALGLPSHAALMAGAALTATSVGITARVLTELGRLGDLEGRVILGAAVIDDVLGILVLTVVAAPDGGTEPAAVSVLRATVGAVGFLVGSIVVGRWAVPWLFGLARRVDPSRVPTILALIFALGLAWLAKFCGSEPIIGAFAAGLLVAGAPQAKEIEHETTGLGRFLVPIFFVSVGAAVDVGALNPAQPESRHALLIAGVLIVVGVAGKVVAGYAPFWFRGNKLVVGAGMVPRGEVGLIFAQIGLNSGVFDAGLFSAITLMVMVTTLMGPVALKSLLAPRVPVGATAGVDDEGVQDLVSDA